MKILSFKCTLLFIITLLFACTSRNAAIPKNDEQAFNTYWNTGEAEITTYKLNQSRYGEMRTGTVSLVYVIEDFSKSRLVKLDEPKKHRADAIRVMKLNTNTAFTTGIYAYNLMSSVFSPIDYKQNPHCLKVAASAQAWSGQSYIHANWKGHRYETHHYDSATKEGETEISLVNAWMEDEVWTKIRISPEDLPTGKINIVPSASYFALSHQELKVYEANASVTSGDIDFTYWLKYPELKRSIEIHFGKDFPHRIFSWKEKNNEQEVSSGMLAKTMRSAYWNHTHNADEPLRDSLNLQD